MSICESHGLNRWMLGWSADAHQWCGWAWRTGSSSWQRTRVHWPVGQFVVHRRPIQCRKDPAPKTQIQTPTRPHNLWRNPNVKKTRRAWTWRSFRGVPLLSSSSCCSSNPSRRSPAWHCSAISWLKLTWTPSSSAGLLTQEHEKDVEKAAKKGTLDSADMLINPSHPSRLLL